MAVSRSREYQADTTGAKIAGNPHSLAAALEKLTMASKRVPMAANPATSHMFIVKPFSGRSVLGLFSTHPPVEKRVERLRQMARGA
jgi:heat shock protein HtpX